ncbi:MAG: TonB-dependent receptor [Bacteroidota bacterium]|nr:TonB-dependent receptor [Bacteroidota bacterium]
MKNNDFWFRKDRIFKKLFFLFIFAVCVLVGIEAQSMTEQESSNQPKAIRGQVLDNVGNTLPGATVLVKGTTLGTITDVNGNYSFSNVPDDAILIFSFIGMKRQEIAISNKTVINIKFEEETVGLEEVVAVGYGSQKKKDLTGSISTVKGDDIIQASTISFDQMLQGKVAGVQITQTSGAPGGNVNVLVRGVNSITGGNQPLYVIDGFAVGAGGGGSDFRSFGAATFTSAGMANNTQNRLNPLASINPSDIESIEILKDASATAIYGSRGANGVIIITTKRGTIGKSQINIDVSYGVQEVEHKLGMMNTQQYAEYLAQGRDNAWIYAGGSASDPNGKRPGYVQVRPEFRNPESITTNTDWQDVIFRIAPVQNYQISSNFGNERTKFFISGGYFNQQGIILTSDYQRFSMRTNVDSQLLKNLKIGSSVSGSYGYGRFPNTEGHYGTGAILNMVLAASPTIPVYNADGSYYFDQKDVVDGLGWLANPLQVLHSYSDNRKVANILVNNYLEYRILDGLTLKTSAGVNYGTNVIKLWRSSKVPYYGNQNYAATAGVTKSESLNWLNENTLNFKHTFSKRHMIDALIGFTAQKDSYDQLSAGASNFPTEYVTYLSEGIVNAGTHFVAEWSMLSFMSRINYSYDSKYLFTATIRRDGSSRFGAKNKWGNFPSFSIGYNLSEEPFMKSLKFIDNLKFRASYGLSGNNQIGNYTSIGLLTTAGYVENNTKKLGLVPSSMSNDDLTWEKSKQINLGFDLSLLSERISLTADIYKNNKTNLLLAVYLPAASGFNSSTQNIGNIENKGIEIGLQTVNVKKKKFRWDSSVIFSANKNKVLKLTNGSDRMVTSGFQVTQVGYPISSFYLMNAIGIFQNAEEVKNSPIQNPNVQPGDLKFEDVNKDGKINANDKKIVGDPWPDFTWGFDNKFTYGNLTLSMSLYGSQGSQTYFQSGETILNSAGVQNQLSLVDRRWKSENDPGDGFMPRAIRNNYAYGFSSTSHFLFDSSFTRIKNVNLSYKLPERLISRLSLGSVSVYANVANLYTFTDYPGYDPESSTAGDNIVNTGVDYMTYPFPRTYTLGVQLTF